ncbi:unnamed protein product [Colias eurytheme]|nr:unnamed protein product [Colias eurytheme]
MASGSKTTSTRRKMEDVLVDPDTQQPIEDSDRKYSCLKSIVEMYIEVISIAFKRRSSESVSMETDQESDEIAIEAAKSITVGNHIVSIIFTVHNVSRQEVKKTITNMIKKTASTSYKITFRGSEYSLDTQQVKKLWVDILKRNGLVYKDFIPTDKENWFGTMGPYLDMFSAFALRVNELRLGHTKMPLGKIDDTQRFFPVSKYGLSGAHHVLLEGTSFPPERRSSIVQSIGPMTAWICMLRSEGIYRKKYAAAVKRAMSHVPCIDDLIELTKSTKQASEISSVTTLLAEILLVTTARQATRMFFPLTMFAAVWTSEKDTKTAHTALTLCSRGNHIACTSSKTS